MTRASTGPGPSSQAVRKRDDGDAGYRVWRASANHFALERVDGRWQITTRASRVLDGQPYAHALLDAGLAGEPAPPGAKRFPRQLLDRNANTTLSNASLASIIAQCPQFGNTCNSALGMVRIGISAMSSGLTRSSRPQVNSVGAATLCISDHGIGMSASRIIFII